MPANAEFVLVGLLLVVVGIPLALERIGPNRFYGFRTRRTLTDRRIWFAVNKVTGKDLIAGGLATAAVAICVPVVWPDADPHDAVSAAFLVLTGIGTMVHGFLVQRRTTRNPPPGGE